jgi:NACalpha-BTF3-like transcription factor
MLLELSKIKIDGGTQSRERISVEVINSYVESSKEGAKFPPIEVFYDGIHHYLVDGFHRYFMYQKLNISQVEVNIQNGTIRDAQWYSFGVNADHGFQRTNSDKRKAVTTVLNDIEWAEYSDREIAKGCKVSPTLVANMRKELVIERPSKKAVTMKGKKTTMETTNIGKKEETEEYDPKEDDIKELVSTNQKLVEENEVLKTKELALSGNEEKVVNEITELQKRVKTLESELNVVKNSRDQFQNKNAELIKEVNYWRNKCKKLEK